MQSWRTPKNDIELGFKWLFQEYKQNARNILLHFIAEIV